MLRKVLGLGSLLLLIVLIGGACAPAVSQKEVQDLQYQVQALSLSLATTQANLTAAQDALRNLQNQNQQIQNQVNETASTCTTCQKTAQTQAYVNPYGCISPYSYNTCNYIPRYTPISYSPYCPYRYYYPIDYYDYYCPWIYFRPPCHHPRPPCHDIDPPGGSPGNMLTFPHPLAEVTASIPSIDPMPANPISMVPLPSPNIPDVIQTPVAEPSTGESFMTFNVPSTVTDSIPDTAIQPAITTFPTVQPINEPGIHVIMPDIPSMETLYQPATPSTTYQPATDAGVITAEPFSPYLDITTNYSPTFYPDILPATPQITETYQNTAIAPTASPVFMPEPLLPPTSVITAPMPVIQPMPVQEPAMAPLPVPVITTEPMWPTAPSTLDITKPPATSQVPAVVTPAAPETAQVEEDSQDAAL